MTTRRRELLIGSAAATLAPLATPAVAQGIKELKLVTSWTQTGMTGLQSSAEYLAESITLLSEGRIKVTVYPAGTLVQASEIFDAVGTGIADMYHTSEYFFGHKSSALYFFCSVPYGFTADEVCAWIDFGGGQALWDEVDAQFNIKPLKALNTGVQMGGWFTKEINSAKDFEGLRYRMPDLGAEVLRRMGATVVTVPPPEIITALKTGAIDATEWVGPWMDMEQGFDRVAGYYYYPGFHEPGSNNALGINKTLWDEMTNSERRIIEAAAQAEVIRSLGRFNAENVKALGRLRTENRVKLIRFNDGLIRVFGKLSKEVLADVAANDPLTRKVYDSYMAFLAGVMDWGELSETGYRRSRRLALS